MKISMRWLGRYVDLDDKAPQQVLLDLTMSTAEVEGIEEFGAGIDDVVVGPRLQFETQAGAARRTDGDPASSSAPRGFVVLEQQRVFVSEHSREVGQRGRLADADASGQEDVCWLTRCE